MNILSAISLREQVTFHLNDDDAIFVLDQHALTLLELPSSTPGFSGIQFVRSLVFCSVLQIIVCTFSFDHFIICPPSIYGVPLISSNLSWKGNIWVSISCSTYGTRRVTSFANPVIIHE
jgi:hypothetical protein